MSTWKEKLKRIFQPGRIPDDQQAAIEQEGVLLLAERIGITVIYRNFKGPGMRFFHKRASGWGTFVLTGRRVVSVSFYKKIMDVPYDHPAFKSINFAVKNNKYLSAAFDPSPFDSRQSGSIEFRFKVPDPKATLALIQAKTR